MTMATMVAMVAMVGGGNEPPADFDFAAENDRFLQLQSKVAKMGKEDLQEAQEIASMSPITNQHLKQVQKACNEFEDIFNDIEDILDKVEENIERGSKAERQNIERRKGLIAMGTRYRDRMDRISATIFERYARSSNAGH